jgi:hypothetical protein
MRKLIIFHKACFILNCTVLGVYSKTYLLCVTDDVPTGSTDVDIQLLEASKAGDLDLVKVSTLFIKSDMSNFTFYQIYQMKQTDNYH